MRREYATNRIGQRRYLLHSVGHSLYSVLVECQSVNHNIRHFAPCSLDVKSICGKNFVGRKTECTVLANLLEPIKNEYDYIIIDCSPSLGLITVNALTAADSVIIPVQAEYFALEGISKLLNTIRIIKSKLNPSLEIEGFLLTMYDARLRLANQIFEELKGHFGDMVFNTVIPRNIRLSEAPSHGLPALLYDASSRGATSHIMLAKEIIAKHKRNA